MVTALVGSNEDLKQCTRRLVKHKTGIIMSKPFCSSMCKIHANNYQLNPTGLWYVDPQLSTLENNKSYLRTSAHRKCQILKAEDNRNTVCVDDKTPERRNLVTSKQVRNNYRMHMGNVEKVSYEKVKECAKMRDKKNKSRFS